MIKKISLLLATAVVFLFAGNAAFANNILINPGFEDGTLSPWYQAVDYGGPEAWNLTTADAHSGQYSATDRGNKLIVQDFAPVLVSHILETSFWLKNDDATINAVYFKYSDFSTEENIFNPTGNWDYVNATAWLDPGKSLVSFGVFGVSGGFTDRTYVDDWKLDVTQTPVPEPATMLLLGSGLIGLVGYGRKKFFKK